MHRINRKYLDELASILKRCKENTGKYYKEIAFECGISLRAMQDFTGKSTRLLSNTNAVKLENYLKSKGYIK